MKIYRTKRSVEAFVNPKIKEKAFLANQKLNLAKGVNLFTDQEPVRVGGVVLVRVLSETELSNYFKEPTFVKFDDLEFVREEITELPKEFLCPKPTVDKSCWKFDNGKPCKCLRLNDNTKKYECVRLRLQSMKADPDTEIKGYVKVLG